MPLLQPVLTGELVDLVSAYNEAPVFAKKLTDVIINYWTNAMSVYGGAPQVNLIKPLLLAGLLDVFSSDNEMPVAAKKIGDSIDSAWLAIIFSGGTHGIGGVDGTQKSKLIQDIKDSMELKEAAPIFAKKFSTAIHIFSVNSTCFGSGSPPIISPFTKMTIS